MTDRLSDLGITNNQLADRLGLSRSAVSMKRHGQRPWLQSEIDEILKLARERDPNVTYEQLFGAELVEAAS